MLKAAGTGLTVLFIAASLLGTTASGWLLGEALSPERAGTLVGPLSLAMILGLLPVAMELVRLVLALCGERIWGKSHFQGLAFAGPLWLACTGYCILMPMLTLAFVPLLPPGSHLLTVLVPAWAALQITAGLLPGITWSGADARPQQTEHTAAVAAARAAAPVKAVEAPAQALPHSTASADDFLTFLSRLCELPAGSKLPRRGRIGSNHEILISQAGLAGLVGRSKPTVRRWLDELERRQRISKCSVGKDTCIQIARFAPKPLGDTRTLNGGAHL